MKRFIIFLMMVFAVSSFCAPEMQANKGKIFRAIGKAFSKTKPRPVPVKPVKVKPVKPAGGTAKDPYKTKGHGSLNRKCSQCSGTGRVKTWNHYTEMYVYTTCSKCHGSGKAR